MITMEMITEKLRYRQAPAGLLTERELQVLDLCCKGMESKQIGHKLGMATSTVNNTRSNVMQKLGARNSVQLGWIASHRGLI